MKKDRTHILKNSATAIVRHFRFNRQVWLLLITVIFVAFGKVVSGQDVEHTKATSDQNLRSNARINPSTLAMELAIPISNLPGRGGTSMPLVFNYSSKVWRVRSGASYNTPTLNLTAADALYADGSVAGWTTTYGAPKLKYAFDDDEFYDCQANAVGILSEGGSPECALYYVKRVRITLPDGATHEFRKDDGVYYFDPSSPTTDRTGTFLSVDGSRMRLEMAGAGSTLYLPDGSRYYFADNSTGNKYTDRHGNVLTYNTAANIWTDSLGRSLASPFPAPIPENHTPPEGTQNVTVPGIGGAVIQYGFVWKKLSSGALASGENLSYDSPTCDSSMQPVPRSPSMFASSATVRLCSGRAEYFDPTVLAEIVLPDGSKYKFKYNKYGEIIRIDYPTGGYEKFEYAQIPPLSSTRKQVYDQANRGVVRRIVGDGTTEYEWLYEAGYTGTDSDGSPYYVTTINPDGTKTKQFLHRVSRLYSSGKNYGFDNPLSGREIETQTIDSTGNIRNRQLTEWETTNGISPGYLAFPKRDIRVKRTVGIVTDPATNTSLINLNENEYDLSGSTDAAQFAQLNLKRVKKYHYKILNTNVSIGDTATAAGLFSNADIANISETDYLYIANYRDRGIVGLVTETRVKDASGNVKARSQIEYDQANYLETANVTNAHHWENPNTTYRGLPTTTRSWTDIANNHFVETHASFDQFGNVRKSWDGQGNYSETQYTDNYADNTNRNSYALPTKTITYAGANGSGTIFESTIKYDFNTGIPVATTDPNGQTSVMEYDASLRPYKTIAPNGHQTITEYGVPDSSGQLPANQRFVKTKSQIDEQKWKEGYAWFDGLGRNIKSQSVASDGDVFVDTEYDAVGRLWKTTNPYRAGEIIYKTENFYDTAGRLYKVKSPDGAEVKTFYSLATTGAQIGTVVTVEDQANKQRRSITNALGQLTRVDEPDVDNGNQLGAIHSPYQPTYYEYDTVGKMKEVTQGVQKRHFLYDSLGRLLRVRQPEQQINPALNLSNGETTNTQWSVGMTYDNNGNVLTVTNAKNVTITNTYDALNRLQARTYSDAVTPTVSYTYDDPNIQFSKGKLTKISSSISEMRYTAFDQTGKLLTSEQVTDGEVFSSGYKYNLSGTLTEQTYPSGRVVKNFLDNDGDLAAIVSKTANASFKNYASNFAYTASGVIKHLQIGNGLWESAKINSRDQVTELNLGTYATDGSLWKLNYDYGELDGNGNVDATKNSGNIAKQTISLSGLANPFVQIYKYDALDRIKEAEEKNNGNQMWKQTWDYDRYGNRTNFTQMVQSQILPINSQTLPQIDTNTNRFLTSPETYQYDADGNLIQDGEGRQFIFNGDNKQIEIKDASNEVVGKYYYDGNGKRIKKVTNTETVIFVYDGMGKLAAEYSTAAPVVNPTTNYTATDPLGSPRVITNKQGQIVSRRDFMPFGEEIQADTTYRKATLKYGTGDNIRQKFTGYQRDEESGLDFAEARYYNNNHGRFTAVDPLLASGKSANPQTFNRYAYTMNRPLILTDPTGLQAGKIVIPSKAKTIASENSVRATAGKQNIPGSIIIPKGMIELKKEVLNLAYSAQAEIALTNRQNERHGDRNPQQAQDSIGNKNTTTKTDETSVSASVQTSQNPLNVSSSSTQTNSDQSENSGNSSINSNLTNTTEASKNLDEEIDRKIGNYINANVNSEDKIVVNFKIDGATKGKSIVEADWSRKDAEAYLKRYADEIKNMATCDFNPSVCPK